MEGANLELLFTDFQMHKADRAKRDPSTGVKRMEQVVLGCQRFVLFVDHPKDFGRALFELELGSVTQPPFALDFLDIPTSQQRGHEPSLLWKRLLERAYDFGQCRTTAAGETHQVAFAGDVDACPIIGSIDGACFVAGKELRMDRSPEDTQDMFCNGRTNRKHGVRSLCCSRVASR